MTTLEMSNEFDVLYNNITSNLAPGLDEYEKSVFLTKAQRQLVTEYFNNRTDVAGGGFDGSQKRLYDFSELIRTAKLFNVNTFKERISPDEKFDRRSKVFLFPLNYFLAVNELVSDYQYQYSVIPLDYAEYQRLMFKPYNLPVKRGAWRIITDKKNCNYCEEFVPYDDDSNVDTPDRNTEINYVIQSSWADQKRNIQICIRAFEFGEIYDPDTQEYDPVASIPADDEYGRFDIEDFWVDTEFGLPAKSRVAAATKWLNDNKTYGICIAVDTTYAGESLEDDECIIKFLQDYFTKSGINIKEDVLKAYNHMDGFVLCSAPSKFKEFFGVTVTHADPQDPDSPLASVTGGKTFITHVIKQPIAEIIGKFVSEPEYKLRYVRTLKPIILANLDNYGDNLTIDGVSQETNCELPEEAHQEIVERAVTLAKIAWQGATATLVAALQLLQRDRDNR